MSSDQKTEECVSIAPTIEELVKKSGATFTKFDYDPTEITNNLVGRWYGYQGFDTIFVKDPSNINNDIKTGFIVKFNETVDMVPLSNGILNPATLSDKNPKGDVLGGESLYGVRYVRIVQSEYDGTQVIDGKQVIKPIDPKFPFQKGATIHEETGYILFCYIGVEDPKDPKNVIQKLTRVVKSLAIPRAQTVLAHDDNVIDKISTEGILTYTLDSQATSAENLIWVVGNGEFTNLRGKVTEFKQWCFFGFKATPAPVFAYVQQTPITFGGFKTVHTNYNILHKQS